MRRRSPSFASAGAVTSVNDSIPNGWREITIDHQSRLIENERVLPRAYVPRHTRGGEMDPDADPADSAWIEGIGDTDNGSGAIVTIGEGSNLRLAADMRAPGWIVVSETAWPGWRAYLDGRRVRMQRANRAFLAVYAPAGQHEIRLRYLPRSFVIGRTISVAVALLLLIGLIVRQVV